MDQFFYQKSSTIIIKRALGILILSILNTRPDKFLRIKNCKKYLKNDFLNILKSYFFKLLTLFLELNLIDFSFKNCFLHFKKKFLKLFERLGILFSLKKMTSSNFAFIIIKPKVY